jgi:16S rRNA (guanine1516-N2)-methyltransferase
MLKNLALCLCDPDGTFAVAALAARLGLPLYSAPEAVPATCTHVLWAGKTGLALGARSQKPEAATRVDFLDGTLQYRLRSSGKRQGLGKAVGLDKASAIAVLDATAGLGRDALVLAHLGCKVTLLEKSSLVHALLEDGFARARTAADAALAVTLGRMQLEHQDALQRFAAIRAGSAAQPDVIYLDPMFPPRNKSAKVKKDLALLHMLLGSEEDFPALLEAARACAKYRVVVKRPGNKTAAAGPAPTFSVPGKSAHFEVYVNSSFSSMR